MSSRFQKNGQGLGVKNNLASTNTSALTACSREFVYNAAECSSSNFQRSASFGTTSAKVYTSKILLTKSSNVSNIQVQHHKLICAGVVHSNTDGPPQKIGLSEFSETKVHSYADRMGAGKITGKVGNNVRSDSRSCNSLSTEEAFACTFPCAILTGSPDET